MYILVTRIIATLVICPVLLLLWLYEVEDYQDSWIIHGVFAFLLTLLVFGAFFKGKFTIAYMFSFMAVAASWEAIEFLILEVRAEKDFYLTVVDTIMDLACGFAGVLVGIILIKLGKRYSVLFT